ncbi:hypothetical protein RKD27_000096 [Streptomyces sp. SAI-126]|uniref:condensation domain-containing protein n=1 Tax=Streptomyces sp. SAI-126 TaxID=3377732 RepID=UPI003C79B258
MPETTTLDLPMLAGQVDTRLAQQRDPASPAHQVAHCVEIHGPVDATLFASALQRVINACETLRLRVTGPAGDPRQEVGPADGWSWRMVDVSDASDSRAAAQKWMRDDMATPPDPERGPHITQALFRAAPDRYFWYQRVHRFLADGYTCRLVAARVGEVYKALADARDGTVGDTFTPIRRLAEEEAQYRASPSYEEDRRFWIRQLTDRPCPVNLAGHFAAASRTRLRHAVELTPRQGRAVRSLTDRLQMGPSALMLAVTALYTGRLTRTDDLVLGLPVSCRTGGTADTAAGMLSNVLAVRLTPRPDQGVIGLICQASQAVEEALLHQRYRLGDVRRDLRVHERVPLAATQAGAVLGDDPLRFGPYPATMHSLCEGPVEDVSCTLRERSADRRMYLEVEANPALYEQAEVATHAARLVRVLVEVVRAPGRLVEEVDLSGDGTSGVRTRASRLF